VLGQSDPYVVLAVAASDVLEPTFTQIQTEEPEELSAGPLCIDQHGESPLSIDAIPAARKFGVLSGGSPWAALIQALPARDEVLPRQELMNLGSYADSDFEVFHFGFSSLPPRRCFVSGRAQILS
jgi:hypothetical protein